MDKKTDILLQLLTLLMKFLTASSTDVKCEPAEIGTNHSISCSSPVVNATITWFKDAGPLDVFLLECSKNTTCVSRNPTFNSNFNGKIEYINNEYRSTIVIYNVRQSPGVIFKCSIDGQPPVNVCSPLEFFTKPEGIQCNANFTINQQKRISIICFLTKVYPSAKILNYLDPSKAVACENDTSSTVGSIKCQSDLPVAEMKEGLNSIDVLIYPDVTSGEKFGVKKQLNISLTFPNTSLGQDCLNILSTTQGYIKQGTPANCTCYVKTQGVPPGGVKWFYNNGTDVEGVNSGESARLQVMFAGKETNQSYNCYGVSDLGKKPGIDFTVRNAYGPDQMSISTGDNKLSYDICSSNKIINVICSLPRLSVAPEPDVEMRVSDGEILDINLNHNSTQYIYMSSYRAKNAGNLSLKCEAFNSIFNELGTSAAFTVYIAGPPLQPPVLTIGKQNYSGNYGRTVEPQKEGSDIDITCQVSGGFPNTYNLTVSCGGIYNNSAVYSSFVNLSIAKVGRQLNGKLCVCKADHVTSCYVNNTSSLRLNISFSAEVQSFTANSNSSSLTVSNNSVVTFVCDTESNPPATVEISKTETITTNTGKANFSKQVDCKDSGEYICKAHNSDFVVANQSFLTLYVKCSLQLRNTMDNFNAFYAQNGKDAVFEFDVFGFPAPVSYFLFKKLQKYEYLVANFSSDNSVKSKYKFAYLPNALPNGIISVSILNVTAEDFTNYTLSINNSIDVELKLSFVLIQVAENGRLEQPIDVLPAAIGGGIGGFAFIFTIIMIIIIFKGKALHQWVWRKSKFISQLQNAEQVHQNSDIYIFKSKDGLGMEINYKHYNDVPITITTATALPRNLKLKSKSALMPTYFNTIDDYSNEADKSFLIEKEIKKNDPAASYTREMSGYQNNDSEVYANT